MPTIHTTRAFTVRLPTGEERYIPKGESEQPQEVAEHWFVVCHLVGTPKGRMPVVEGPDGLMIEADEAGQRVHEGAQLLMHQPDTDAMMQEGPIDWSTKNPNAVEAARVRAEEAGAQQTEPVDGPKQARELTAERTGRNRAAPAPVPAPVPAPSAPVPDAG